jgi:hypothetical protein
MSLANVASAVSPPHMSNPLTFYVLNANGLVHAGKLSYINTVINTWKPHVFVLSESKTNTRTSSSLPFSDYNIFEEPGIRTAGDHLYKWGLVMGVQKDIQIL